MFGGHVILALMVHMPNTLALTLLGIFALCLPTVIIIILYQRYKALHFVKYKRNNTLCRNQSTTAILAEERHRNASLKLLYEFV
jgi:hypothetical protein